MEPVKQTQVPQAQNVMPQIILNQPGADLINRLLDAALKGGGIANLALVKDVIAIVNRRQAPPQEETPKKEVVSTETKKPVTNGDEKKS